MFTKCKKARTHFFPKFVRFLTYDDAFWRRYVSSICTQIILCKNLCGKQGEPIQKSRNFTLQLRRYPVCLPDGPARSRPPCIPAKRHEPDDQHLKKPAPIPYGRERQVFLDSHSLVTQERPRASAPGTRGPCQPHLRARKSPASCFPALPRIFSGCLPSYSGRPGTWRQK